MSDHTTQLASTHRRLFLRGLALPVQIGIHDFEQLAPQRVIFDVDLYVPLAKSTSNTDDIAHVVDYDFVRGTAQRLAQSRYNLQETLCDALLAAMLANPGVAAARVSTRKPDVYPDCEAVGVERFAFKPGVVA
jgi:7,8-dihydroneopterin aldolase/epimerase/oxygenase